MLLQCRECTNMTVQIYRHIGVTYMDVAFPYKEAITNAYGQPAHVQQQHMWPAIYILEEKAKGQSSILYGKASV